MTEVRIFRVKSRLATLALGHGGPKASEAVAAADRAIAAKRDDLLTVVDGVLLELEARFGAASADGSVGDYLGLYQLASSVIDMSVCLPDSLIEKAAFALCDAVDLSEEFKIWDRQTVEVHIMALRLLRQGGADMTLERRERVVEGLQKVKAKRIGGVHAGVAVRAGSAGGAR